MATTYSVAQAAKAIGVHPETLRRWIAAGLIKATRAGERGHYRIPQGEVDRLTKPE
jgi:excisionase family DNA binding protein